MRELERVDPSGVEAGAEERRERVSTAVAFRRGTGGRALSIGRGGAYLGGRRVSPGRNNFFFEGSPGRNVGEDRECYFFALSESLEKCR